MSWAQLHRPTFHHPHLDGGVMWVLQTHYVCLIDLRKAYNLMNLSALWMILQWCYHFSGKFVCIIRAMHKWSIAAVYAYGNTSREFTVTYGAWQGCVLTPIIFNLYLDSAVQMEIEEHHCQGKGVRVGYLPEAILVGNRRKITHETL